MNPQKVDRSIKLVPKTVVQDALMALQSLPDKSNRISLKDSVYAMRAEILIKLSRHYSIAEVLDTLNKAGFTINPVTLRTYINEFEKDILDQIRSAYQLTAPANDNLFNKRTNRDTPFSLLSYSRLDKHSAFKAFVIDKHSHIDIDSDRTVNELIEAWQHFKSIVD